MVLVAFCSASYINCVEVKGYWHWFIIQFVSPSDRENEKKALNLRDWKQVQKVIYRAQDILCGIYKRRVQSRVHCVLFIDCGKIMQLVQWKLLLPRRGGETAVKKINEGKGPNSLPTQIPNSTKKGSRAEKKFKRKKNNGNWNLLFNLKVSRDENDDAINDEKTLGLGWNHATYRNERSWNENKESFLPGCHEGHNKRRVLFNPVSQWVNNNEKNLFHSTVLLSLAYFRVCLNDDCRSHAQCGGIYALTKKSNRLCVLLCKFLRKMERHL